MRQEVACRPALVAFLGLIAGLSSGFEWINALFALMLVPLVWKSRSLAVLALSVVCGLMLRPIPTTAVNVDGGAYRGIVHVLSVPSSERDSLLAIVSAGSKRYRLRLPPTSRANLGDELKVDAAIVPLNEQAVRQRLEVAELRALKPSVVVSHGWCAWKLGTDLRSAFLRFVEDHSNPRLVGIIDAMAFNVTGDLGAGLSEDLRRTGTVHIVSASGLHVAIVAGFIAFLLFQFPIPRWMQISFLAACLFLYAAATGFHPPMIRSVVMVLVGAVAYMCSKEPDALSSLSVAGLLTLLLQPEAVASLGFQLSYLAVGGLLLFSRQVRFTDKQGVVSRVKMVFKELAWASFVATLATAPIIAYSTGQFSLTSIFSNLLVVPVVAVVVVTSLLACLAYGVVPVIGVGLLRVVVEPLAAWISASIEWTASWKMAAIEVPPFSAYWLVAIYVGFAMLYQFRPSPTTD